MKTYEVRPDGRDFNLLERTDGHETVVGRFNSEDAARQCLMRYLTILNAASLARWVRGSTRVEGAPEN
jgi:hypothetical protein